MASEQDSPNGDENNFFSVSDSADSSSFNTDEPQPLPEPESQIAGLLQPPDDVVRRGQHNIITELLPVPFVTGKISSKEFQLAPSGKDLPIDTTISPVEENPEHLQGAPITKLNAEAQLSFSKQKQGDGVQNPSADTRKPSSRDQQSLSGKVSTLQPQSDYVDELKKSASRELEKTPATEEITRKKMEEIESLVKQLYAKVNEPDTRRLTSLERSVEDRFRTVHEYIGVIAQQMEVLNKVTGLSPDSSVKEAWKALLSQSVDRFEPGMFLEVNPCIISYECSTRPNGIALVYVRESFKGLLESIMSVHNAHRAQSTTSDHDSTINATQNRMESNTATGSTTATADQTNPIATATERHTDESPASTTTAITTSITGNKDEATPITGNAIEPTSTTRNKDEPTPITGNAIEPTSITRNKDEPTPITGPGQKYMITGTPGTGKSCFAYYLLHHLLAKEGDSVLYQNCHNNMKCFVVITRLKGNDYDVASYQMPSNGIPKPSHGFLGKGEDSVSKVKPVSWYIFDSGHKSGAKPESTAVPTIVISSPDCDQYKDFMLEGPKKFYMPTWEWPEIDALVRQLHPNKSEEMNGSIQRAKEDCRQEEINTEEKNERIAEAFQTFSELARANEAFIRHGGVIRDVLNTDSEDRLKSLHKAVDRSNVEMVLQFLQARGDVSSAVSHRILHQKCDKRLENGCLDYQNPSIRFASKYVHDRFWDKHLQKKADLKIEQLSLMYELIPADGSPHSEECRRKFGSKFEEFVHKTIASGEHEAKELLSADQAKSPKTLKSIQLNFSSRIRRTSRFQKKDHIVCTIDTEPKDKNVYVYPSQKDFPAFDAFLPDQKYLLQITIAKNHPVAVPELLSFIYTRGWRPKDVTLVFVVLDQIYDSFSYQDHKKTKKQKQNKTQESENLEEVNKLSPEDIEDFKKIKQYAMPMPPRQQLHKQ